MPVIENRGMSKDALGLHTSSVSAMRSWSPYFRNRIRLRRYARSFMKHGDIHVAYSWAEIAGYKEDVAGHIKSHAPWLNVEAIAYRNAIASTSVNGWFVS